jgi:hypothetical protein
MVKNKSNPKKEPKHTEKKPMYVDWVGVCRYIVVPILAAATLTANIISCNVNKAQIVDQYSSKIQNESVYYEVRKTRNGLENKLTVTRDEKTITYVDSDNNSQLDSIFVKQGFLKGFQEYNENTEYGRGVMVKGQQVYDSYIAQMKETRKNEALKSIDSIFNK